MASTSHSRRALLVGVAQLRRKPGVDGPWEPADPAAMMAGVIRSAAEDAADAQLVQEADLLACVEPVAWRYDDVISTVATLAGTTGPASPLAPRGLTLVSGGSAPCELLNEVAARIIDGDSRIALLAGADAGYSRRRATTEGVELTELGWPAQRGNANAVDGEAPLTSELEGRHGMTELIHCFALYENALRFESGRSIDAHQRFLGEMMSAHAAVAATNPYSWLPFAYAPAEIATPTPGSRTVCFPYPDRMNALTEVDQAAALVVMSSDEADRRGIPAGQRVAFLGGASATDAPTATERASFTSSPACRAAAATALEHAALYETEIELFDLYSCYPSAVEFAMKALSLTIDDPRPRTVTGGMAYAGGPGDSYSMHALATMVHRLRSTSSNVGYVSALGRASATHAVCVLSGDPARIEAATGQSTSNVRVPDRARLGPPLSATPAAGPATVETYTVEYAIDGRPVRSILVVKLHDGHRTVANGDLAEARTLVTREAVGRRGMLTPGADGGPNHFTLAAAAQ
jgi:acetyl-CoA C-acetyltransferase